MQTKAPSAVEEVPEFSAPKVDSWIELLAQSPHERSLLALLLLIMQGMRGVEDVEESTAARNIERRLKRHLAEYDRTGAATAQTA